MPASNMGPTLKHENSGRSTSKPCAVPNSAAIFSSKRYAYFPLDDNKA